MSLPTPSQSVSHKRFHQCVNHKKKLSLRHPLPTFGNFSFFQASLWPGVDKVLQKLTKSYKSELKHLFQCCILIPRKCPRKAPFQHTVPPTLCKYITTEPATLGLFQIGFIFNYKLDFVQICDFGGLASRWKIKLPPLLFCWCNLGLRLWGSSDIFVTFWSSSWLPSWYIDLKF